ncbi:amidohydrolase family protein [Exilibacterium tricleocarpae]|uniref:Amidohydrolase family protein n=1 Tax=Exilibacterium tricleocarpae TaxID=2591008 RepID=A0A545TVS3_9GAMM|nr:amidohydrolase family protein [Exilibacterium tricleocarpae]TQV81302.1 amidohydrolase family protein [Exilibacterium tricleocarpae]
MTASLLIKNGTVYDGTGAAPVPADILIDAGSIKAVGPALQCDTAEVIDARGHWVLPGFIDLHTHYDAELEVFPGLRESVRHGVTTVVMGNCSLSLAMGEPADVVDLFARVENLPRELLREWVGERMTWRTPAEYYTHLERLNLGPNVASFLGHSNVRLAALGKQRCLQREPVTDADKHTMGNHLQEAIEAGYLGMSIDMLPWHRWMGYKYNGASIPSQYAHMDEYRYLAGILRRHGRVMQATPNANRKASTLLLSLLSTGLLRAPLKLSMLASLDFKGNRALGQLPALLCSVINRLGRGNLRFQSLACPFELWSDGYNTPIFEEFHAGARLMNADTRAQRQQLFADPDWRRQFRREWLSVFNRSFHRDLTEMTVVACPDASLVGKTFSDIAADQGCDPVDCLLDLLAEHDQKLRWYSVVANDRPAVLRKILKRPFNQIGFSDAGAHNRNMGFQNAHLCLLRDANQYRDGLSVAAAIHRLTGDIAAWLGLDTGVLATGKPADITVVDPAALATDLTGATEINDPRFNGDMRMVSGSGAAVRQVIVRGQPVCRHGSFCDDYEQRPFGRLLRSQLH